MRRKLKITVLLLTGILATRGALLAHHGNAAYDDKDPITIKGTVTDFLWVNPHVQVFLDVKNEQGEVVHWGCETVSPSKLFRSGWTRDSLKVGDQVSIRIYPAKSHAPVGLIRRVVLASGKELGTEEQPQ